MLLALPQLGTSSESDLDFALNLIVWGIRAPTGFLVHDVRATPRNCVKSGGWHKAIKALASTCNCFPIPGLHTNSKVVLHIAIF